MLKMPGSIIIAALFIFSLPFILSLLFFLIATICAKISDLLELFSKKHTEISSGSDINYTKTKSIARKNYNQLQQELSDLLEKIRSEEGYDENEPIFQSVKDCIENLPYDILEYIEDKKTIAKYIFIYLIFLDYIEIYLSSGELHIYRGGLNFLGFRLLISHETTLDYLVEMAVFSKEEANARKNRLLKEINRVG